MARAEILKRCPFCGGEARLIECCHGSKAECFDCGASTKYYLDGIDTNEESARNATEAWNMRTS
jgi:Lar family restriction alleviation protein